MNPTEEPFFGSKTMILLTLGMSMIVVLVLVGVLVKVLLGEDVFEMISAGILGISGHSGAGTVRNVQVDAPIRQQYAQAATATPGPLNAPPV